MKISKFQLSSVYKKSMRICSKEDIFCGGSIGYVGAVNDKLTKWTQK